MPLAIPHQTTSHQITAVQLHSNTAHTAHSAHVVIYQHASTLDMLYDTHLPSGLQIVRQVSQTMIETLSSGHLLCDARPSYDSAGLGLHACSDLGAVAVAVITAVAADVGVTV